MQVQFGLTQTPAHAFHGLSPAPSAPDMNAPAVLIRLADCLDRHAGRLPDPFSICSRGGVREAGRGCGVQAEARNGAKTALGSHVVLSTSIRLFSRANVREHPEQGGECWGSC